MEALKYFEKNAIWNGTIVMNIVQLMENYHNHKMDNIKPNTICSAFFSKGVNTTSTVCMFCGKEEWEH